MRIDGKPAFISNGSTTITQLTPLEDDVHHKASHPMPPLPTKPHDLTHRLETVTANSFRLPAVPPRSAHFLQQRVIFIALASRLLRLFSG